MAGLCPDSMRGQSLHADATMSLPQPMPSKGQYTCKRHGHQLQACASIRIREWQSCWSQAEALGVAPLFVFQVG